uniref:Reverse transcriptase zinc-binding domain-containing protein n=1 Tax=Fagus sylvatica TaxID=28930 RepID=A0A2N9GTM5_FAGSY
MGEVHKYHLVGWDRFVPRCSLGVLVFGSVPFIVLLGKWLWRFVEGIIFGAEFWLLNIWREEVETSSHGCSLWKHIRMGWDAFLSLSLMLAWEMVVAFLEEFGVEIPSKGGFLHWLAWGDPYFAKEKGFCVAGWVLCKRDDERSSLYSLLGSSEIVEFGDWCYGNWVFPNQVLDLHLAGGTGLGRRSSVWNLFLRA